MSNNPMEDHEMPTPKATTIPRPWDHTIEIHSINGATDPAQTMAARCTCTEWERFFGGGTEALTVATEGQRHLMAHPQEPEAIVQLATGDYVVVLMVPGNGKKNKVPMTITIPEAVFNDGSLLAKHLGPIGSANHFALRDQRRYEQDHPHHGHGVRVLDVSQIMSQSFSGVAGIQSLLDLLRRENDGEPDPGVAIFEHPKQNTTETSES